MTPKYGFAAITPKKTGATERFFYFNNILYGKYRKQRYGEYSKLTKIKGVFLVKYQTETPQKQENDIKDINKTKNQKDKKPKKACNFFLRI